MFFSALFSTRYSSVVQITSYKSPSFGSYVSRSHVGRSLTL